MLQRGALGKEVMVLGGKQLGHLGLVHHLADLGAHELGNGLIGRLVQQDIVEGVEAHMKATFLPGCLVDLLTFLGGDGKRGALGGLIGEPETRGACPVPQLAVVGLELAHIVFIQTMVAPGNIEVGRALEHKNVLGLTSHLGHHLHAGRPRADHSHLLAREIHFFMRPLPGVIPRSLEALEPLELRDVRRGQTTHRRDEKPCAYRGAIAGGDAPEIVRLVEMGCGDTRVELDVGSQIKPVGDKLQVAQDFRLAGKALAPGPLLQDLFRETIREHVIHAFGIAASAGIAVPVPGAAHIGTRLVDPG